MNEELKNQLAQFLEKALHVANKGIDTAGEQIPMILQEIVYWKMSLCLTGMFIAVALGIVLFFVFKKCREEAEGPCDKLGFSTCMKVFPLLSFGAFLLILPNFVKTLVAPRLVIIEYLKGLL